MIPAASCRRRTRPKLLVDTTPDPGAGTCTHKSKPRNASGKARRLGKTTGTNPVCTRGPLTLYSQALQKATRLPPSLAPYPQPDNRTGSQPLVLVLQASLTQPVRSDLAGMQAD